MAGQVEGGREPDDAGATGRPAPTFGPRGYLPERAARRARKIVLRAPLGLHWVVATLLAGALVLVAGLVFLRSAGAPPGPPFVAVGEVEAVGDARLLDDPAVLLVGAGGRVRAIAVEQTGARLCPASRRLESPDGRVWDLGGRALDGGASLAAHPAVVHAGTVYVDPMTRLPAPETRDRGVTAACASGELVPPPG